MDREAVRAWAQQRMGQADDAPMERGFRFYHGERVAALALRLADRLSLAVDRDVVYAAGLLHDLGKSGGQPGKGHAERGADTVRAELGDLLTGRQLAQVARVIAYHNKRPRAGRHRGAAGAELEPEVLLVQDADLLDHFGLTGVWMMMHWNAADHRASPGAMRERFAAYAAQREEQARPLNYAASRAEFDARWQKMQRFFAALAEEEEGKLTNPEEGDGD